MKNVFYISLGLLIPIAVLLGVYNLAFKKETTASKTASGPSIENQALGVQTNKKIAAIGTNGVIKPKLILSEEKIFYFSKDGTLFQMSQEGNQKKEIGKIAKGQFVDAQWSSDGSKVIMQSIENGSTIFTAYTIADKKTQQLTGAMDWVVWDSVAGRIIYKYYDAPSKERSLNISNVDGSEIRKVATLDYKKVDIMTLPKSSLISYWNIASKDEESKLYVVGSMGGDPRQVLSGIFGGDFLWAPDGEKALVSGTVSRGDSKMNLGTVSLEGVYKSLNIPTTVSKAVWSSDNKTIFYALPTADGSQNGSDTFWSVDVQTGSKKRLVELEEIDKSFNAGTLFLSATEDALYFINQTDNALYRISL